jgi:hypothetical protein
MRPSSLMRHRLQPEFAAQGVNLVPTVLCHGSNYSEQADRHHLIVADKVCDHRVHRWIPLRVLRPPLPGRTIYARCTVRQVSAGEVMLATSPTIWQA